MPSNNCRDHIFNLLNQHAEEKDFYVVNADFTGRPFLELERKYPGRLVQVGIAEQNMISIACGLALCGKRVVTYSPNPFEYLRAYDQIRNGLCMMKLPVTIVANGMGIVNPACGATHFVTEDYQMFSLLPNMEIITVTDENLAKMAAEYIAEGVPGPTYVRFDFLGDGEIGPISKEEFRDGFRLLKKGSGPLVIAQGYAVRTAMKATEDTEASVLEIFRRPFQNNRLLQIMEEYKDVLVIEEQQLRGGLGSELLELLGDHSAEVRLERMGVDYGKEFPHTFGNRGFWMEQFEIDAESVRRRIAKL